MSAAQSSQWSKLMVARVLGSVAFRLGCYAVMIWLALLGEVRAAPTLPDAVLAVVPYVETVDRYNYLLWLASYVPLALILLAMHPARFVRYSMSAGFIGLIRGVCIFVTGLGPVNGHDVNVGLSDEKRWSTFWHLVNPFGFFNTDTGARVYLTKDLFFSGHTATTFLLLLYCWSVPKLRWPALVCHVLIVASVFLAHLHYTIDVIGAYAITFSVFTISERVFGRGASKRSLAM